MKKIYKRTIQIFLLLIILVGSFFCWNYYDLYLAPFVISEKEPIIKKTDGQYCLRGSMTIRTRLEIEPTVNVDYLLPCTENGEPLPEAADLVYYQSGARCRGTIDRTEIIRYASYRRLGIFCFDIFTDMDDPYFVTPEAGWHDVALAIQEEICRKYQLPKRKLLLSGESAGASLVSQMAAAYPDQVEAVATVGGSRFRHFPTGTKVKIFLLHTWDDSLIAFRVPLLADLDQKNILYLAGNTAPDWTARTNFLFYHAPGEEAFQLLEAYLAGIAEQRRANNGVLPDDMIIPSEEFSLLWENRTLNIIEKALDSPHSITELAPRYPSEVPPPDALVLIEETEGTKICGILRDIASYLSYLGYRVLLTTDAGCAKELTQKVPIVILNGNSAIEILEELKSFPSDKLKSVVIASEPCLQTDSYLSQITNPTPFRTIFLFHNPEEWVGLPVEFPDSGNLVFERTSVTAFAAPQKSLPTPERFRFPPLIQPE